MLSTKLRNEGHKAVEFYNIRCKWNSASKQDTLKNITLDIYRNIIKDIKTRNLE